MVKDIKLGTTQVQRAYAGESLIFEYVPPDTTAPITSIRPLDTENNPTNTYDAPVTVYLDVNEPSDTYYTIDGSTPTTASTKYVGDGIYVDSTTTFKYFSVDASGNQETVKETTYTINTATSFRYVRFIGYGDAQFPSTTRLVELQAWHGTTNRLLNLIPTGEPVNTGGTIDKATDGLIDHTSGTYPIWWSGEGIPTLTYDMGDWFALDTMNVVMFSTVNDPRATRFILQISTDNANWTTVADYSTNTTVQSESGWEFAV